MRKSNRRRKRIGHTIRVVRREIHEIDQIANMHERVIWRAAELGLDLVHVARRMGILKQGLHRRLHDFPTISTAFLARLMTALEMGDDMSLWHKPLPVPERVATRCASKLTSKAR